MPDGSVPSISNGLGGKSIVRRLQFLQARKVRALLGQPLEKIRQMTADAIDVESGNHSFIAGPQDSIARIALASLRFFLGDGDCRIRPAPLRATSGNCQ